MDNKDKDVNKISSDVLLSIINDLPNYVFYKDKNLIYRACNKNFAIYAGFKQVDEVIGKSDYEMPWSKQEAEIYQNEDRQVLATRKPLASKEVSISVAGDQRKLLISKSPLFSKNKIVSGVLCIYIDITEKKRAEELALIESNKKLEIANKSKSEFIANMSHDLRTPITGMLGMVQDMLNVANQTKLSMSEEGFQEYRSALQNISETVLHDSELLMGAIDELLQLCNEILEVTRIESGSFGYHLESFDINELVEHNIELFKPTAQHKKLQLSYDIDQDVPRYLKGYSVYLDRILLNLVGNGLKFTEKGEVKICVMLANNNGTDISVGANINLTILVKDTGIGIPEDKFDVIFEHFSRLTPSYEGLYKGAGLGLYTVKRYVEAMQGTIEVNSKLGKGACFTVELPLTVSDHTDCSKKSIRFPTSVKPATDKTILKYQANVPNQNAIASILLVEDNKLAAIAVTLNLKTLNCHVNTAEDGSQAIKMAQEGSYDLIFMDIGLPDFSGIEVTKKIRALNDPVKSQVPIVALTGHANNPEMRQEAIDTGMQEVLSKPAQPLEIESVLHNYVFKVEAQKGPRTRRFTQPCHPNHNSILS